MMPVPYRAITLLAVGLASCTAELPTHSELPDHPVDETPTTTTPVALFSGGDCPAAWNCTAVDGSVRSQWLQDLSNRIDPNADPLCLDALSALDVADLFFTDEFSWDDAGAAPVGGTWAVFNAQIFQLGYDNFHRDPLLHEAFHLIEITHEDLGGAEQFQQWISSNCFGRSPADWPGQPA
jgi:hypothetical protein